MVHIYLILPIVRSTRLYNQRVILKGIFAQPWTIVERSLQLRFCLKWMKSERNEMKSRVKIFFSYLDKEVKLKVTE